MSRPRLAPPGLRPLTKAERRRLIRENAKALFPQIVLQRYEATVVAFEAKERPALEQRADAYGEVSR